MKCLGKQDFGGTEDGCPPQYHWRGPLFSVGIFLMDWLHERQEVWRFGKIKLARRLLSVCCLRPSQFYDRPWGSNCGWVLHGVWSAMGCGGALRVDIVFQSARGRILKLEYTLNRSCTREFALLTIIWCYGNLPPRISA